MVQKLLKYLLVLGVALTGFQLNAYADDEKDKDKSKDKTLNANVSAKDSIIIKVSDDDVSVGDTLVFDDYDDDEGSSNSNSLLAQDTSSKIVIISCRGQIACSLRIPREEVINVVYFTPQDSDDSSLPSDSPTTPLVDVSTTLSMKVFPNPANADNQPITIEHNLTSEADIKIFSVDGKLIKQLVAHSKQTIVNDLPSGFYLVNITSNNQSASSRLIVK